MSNLKKDARGNPKSAFRRLSHVARVSCAVRLRAVREEVHAPRIGVFLIRFVRVRVFVVVVPLRRPRDGRVARRALPRQDVTSRVVRAHQSGFDGVSVLLERPRDGGGRHILIDVEHRRSRPLARLRHAGTESSPRARARVLPCDRRSDFRKRHVFLKRHSSSLFPRRRRESRRPRLERSVEEKSKKNVSKTCVRGNCAHFHARSVLHLPCLRLSLPSPSG